VRTTGQVAGTTWADTVGGPRYRVERAPAPRGTYRFEVRSTVTRQRVAIFPNAVAAFGHCDELNRQVREAATRGVAL
jgi:DNA-binding sugar fermentation-stimulating protein